MVSETDGDIVQSVVRQIFAVSILFEISFAMNKEERKG